MLIEIIKGDFSPALIHYKSAIELFDPSLPFPWELTPSGYIEIGAKSWAMVCYQIAGFMDQAKKLADRHLDYTKDHQDPITLYHIYTFPPLYKLHAREWQAAESGIAIYLPIVRKFGDPVFTLTAEVYYYIAKAFQGEREAFDITVKLMHTCFEVGFKTFAVSLSPFIAELYLQLSEYESALNLIDKTLEHVNSTGTHIQTSELYRIKGLVLLAQGTAEDQVEQYLAKALEISKKQSAKTYELRAAKELGQLWHKQGKAKPAYNLLSEVYNWFTEGHNSVDLMEARAVLDELESVTMQK